jgi:isocitrate/isopropylmalate dehydrogenase
MTTKSCGDWLWPASKNWAGRTPRLVALGGDGIGREVVDAAVEVLEAADSGVEILQPRHGKDVPGGFSEEARLVCDQADAVLFGAAEAPSLPILLYLRFERAAYANIRPAASLFGEADDVDLVIVRELSEGLYPGREGELRDLGTHWPDLKDALGRPLPREGKFAIRVVTPEATRRIARHAARLAAYRAERRSRAGKVTIVTKQNVLPMTDGLFRSICEEEASAVGVAFDHLYVDEAARRLASRPAQFDVIVTTNLFGDILSDVASEAVGGMPVAPSAGLAEGFAYFEPVHGSGPDIAGKGIANPVGAILSGAMALHYLGRTDAGQRVVRALQQACARGIRPSDMGGRANTREFVAAVRAALQEGKP